MTFRIDTGNVSRADWAAVCMLTLQYIFSALQGTSTHRSGLGKLEILISFRVPIHVFHIFTLIILLEDYGFATAVLYLCGNAVIEIMAILKMPPKHSVEGLFKNVTKTSRWLFLASVLWSVIICAGIIIAIGYFKPHETPIGKCSAVFSHPSFRSNNETRKVREKSCELFSS